MTTTYKYRALNRDGSQKQGKMAAESKTQVTGYLIDHNLTPIKIEEVKNRLSQTVLNLFKKTDYEALIMFTNNLRTTYKAGIPLLRALSIIKVGPEGGRFNSAIEKIRFDVQAGKSLSNAMDEHQLLFTPVYSQSIAAGEESGKLDDILDELALILEKDMEITRLIKSGLRYPIIVFVLIGFAFVVLMTYVMPKFIDFYSSFNADLPLPSQIMIATSNLITQYWPILLVSIGLIIFGIKAFIRSESGRLFVDKQILKLPVFGNLIIKGNIARFAFMFRILFKSGLPIIKSLNILSESIKNRSIGIEIKKLEELFRRGSESEIVTSELKYFPDLSKQMIAIGLETGSLDNMLEEIGNHYSKEV
ncbi:type II secretion system F family protein, partial [Candidatus Zixiibacteriota bacterium]